MHYYLLGGSLSIKGFFKMKKFFAIACLSLLLLSGCETRSYTGECTDGRTFYNVTSLRADDGQYVFRVNGKRVAVSGECTFTEK